MSPCEEKQISTSIVPDFTVTGFDSNASKLTDAHAQLKDVKALKLSVCVGASYDSSTNEICFTIPIYGDFCVPSPVKIPVGAAIKACAQTCGSIIPSGLKVSIYLNDSVIFSTTLVGSC